MGGFHHPVYCTYSRTYRSHQSIRCRCTQRRKSGGPSVFGRSGCGHIHDFLQDSLERFRGGHCRQCQFGRLSHNNPPSYRCRGRLMDGQRRCAYNDLLWNEGHLPFDFPAGDLPYLCSCVCDDRKFMDHNRHGWRCSRRYRYGPGICSGLDSRGNHIRSIFR